MLVSADGLFEGSGFDAVKGGQLAVEHDFGAANPMDERGDVFGLDALGD